MPSFRPSLSFFSLHYHHSSHLQDAVAVAGVAKVLEAERAGDGGSRRGRRAVLFGEHCLCRRRRRRRQSSLIVWSIVVSSSAGGVAARCSSFLGQGSALSSPSDETRGSRAHLGR